MPRYSHNGASSIAHQHVIRDKDRNLFTVGRVYRLNSFQPDACFFLRKLRPFKVRFLQRFLLILPHLFIILNLILPFFQIGVFRRHHHIRHAKHGIRPGCIDSELLPRRFKIHLRSFGTSNPVLLLNLYPFDIIQIVQIIDQPLRVFGNRQHPLRLHPALHFTSATLAYAADHFLIGQSHFTGGAPVDCHLFFIR